MSEPTTEELIEALQRLTQAVTAHRQELTIANLNELADAEDHALAILAKQQPQEHLSGKV